MIESEQKVRKITPKKYEWCRDITEESFESSINELRKLLRTQDEMLITITAEPMQVFKLINQITEFKEKVHFRFKINSYKDRILAFWEPNTPTFQERFLALRIAYRNGFKTSVSMEPYLDIDPTQVIHALHSYVTESIWVGKMNYIQAKNILPEEKKFYDYQRKICSEANINKIVDDLKNLPEKIKDKIKLSNLLESDNYD